MYYLIKAANEKSTKSQGSCQPGPGIKILGTMSLWVCLEMEYTSNYSHWIGKMRINHWDTIGFRATLFSDNPLFLPSRLLQSHE